MTVAVLSLIEIVARIIGLRRKEVTVSPAWVATETMVQIDPTRTGPAICICARSRAQRCCVNALSAPFFAKNALNPIAQKLGLPISAARDAHGGRLNGGPNFTLNSWK